VEVPPPQHRPEEQSTLAHFSRWPLASVRDTLFRMSLIVSDPRIMMGKPVIVGTRITVESILERLAAGEPIADIVASHPRLTEAAVREALAFAASALRADVTYPVAS
jgi:uncharacterized protein (DUF433 family)